MVCAARARLPRAGREMTTRFLAPHASQAHNQLGSARCAHRIAAPAVPCRCLEQSDQVSCVDVVKCRRGPTAKIKRCEFDAVNVMPEICCIQIRLKDLFLGKLLFDKYSNLCLKNLSPQGPIRPPQDGHPGK